MFKSNHYVPVIRWRKAEYAALSDLKDYCRKNITPIIEIFPNDFKTKELKRNKKPYIYTPEPETVFIEKIEQIKEKWGNLPFFIDLLHIDENIIKSCKIHPIQIIMKHAKNGEINPIPVTSTNRSENYNYAIKKTLISQDKKQICLRLDCDEITDKNFAKRIQMLLNLIDLQQQDVHLVVDCKITKSDKNYSNLLNAIPNIKNWKTFTILSGAFPQDLSSFQVGENILEREDWCKWKNLQKMDILRYPAFGDYTIQYPYLRDIPIPFNMSASLRYTAEKHWVIMRGMGVQSKNSSGYAQYPANALMLTFRDEFCGGEFSVGDQYIETMGNQTDKTGNASTWLQAAINHHLTFVSQQAYKETV